MRQENYKLWCNLAAVHELSHKGAGFFDHLLLNVSLRENLKQIIRK